MDLNEIELLRYIPDTFGTIRAIGIDKYPGEMAIARELIQNADDAYDRRIKPTFVRFIFKESLLIIEHNGKPFSKPNDVEDPKESDFYRISHIGAGKTDEDMTGTFGIGFSSVFHITDKPRIESNGWNFEIIPNEKPRIEEIPFDPLTRIYLPYRLNESELSQSIKAEIFDINKQEKFKSELPNEAYRSILFLRHIKKIELIQDGDLLLSISKTTKYRLKTSKGTTCQFVYLTPSGLYANNGEFEKERWIVYLSSRIPVPIEFYSLRRTHKQDVGIALFCDKGGKGKIQHAQFMAYTVLPIKETDFKFSYNASKFYIVSGRMNFDLKEGLKRVWNLWQASNIASLLAYAVSNLAKDKNYRHLVYWILPREDQPREELEEEIYKKFKSIVIEKEIRFCHTSKNNIVYPGKLWVGGHDLEGLLFKSQFEHFLAPSFMDSGNVLIEEYNANAFILDVLLEYLEENQTNSQFKKIFKNPDSVRTLYKVLLTFDINDNFLQRMKQLDILLTEDKTLRSVKYGVYFPADKDMPSIQEDDIMHHGCYSSTKSKRFLSNVLRIRKMKLKDLIKDSFLRRLDQYSKKQIFDFMIYLMKRKKDVLKDGEIKKALSNNRSRIILQTKGEYGDDIYFKSQELFSAFGSRLKYVRNEYEKQNITGRIPWQEFLSSIGVLSLPPPNIVCQRVSEISERGYSRSSIREVKAIMDFLKLNWKKYYMKRKDELHLLKEIAWIPTNQKKLSVPHKIYIDKAIKPIVGDSAAFLAFQVPPKDPIVRFLNLPKEPFLEQVVEYLLSHSRNINNSRDMAVDFQIYNYLDRKATKLSPDSKDKLRMNRCLWFKGKLWHPNEVYLRDLSKEFGPNGMVRCYIHNQPLKELKDLCNVLNLSTKAIEPDDYARFIIDSVKDGKVRGNWHIKTLKKAYSVTASEIQMLDETLLNELKDCSSLLTKDGNLSEPFRCVLVGNNELDSILMEKIEQAGVEGIPIVTVTDPELEIFFETLGAILISKAFGQKCYSKSELGEEKSLSRQMKQTVSWINGIEFARLRDRKQVKDLRKTIGNTHVFHVNSLEVAYYLDTGNAHVEGSPISEKIYLQSTVDRMNLYVTEDFHWNNDKDLTFLISLLIPYLNPKIDKITWILALNQLLKRGQIDGCSPWTRRKRKEPIVTNREKTEISKLPSPPRGRKPKEIEVDDQGMLNVDKEIEKAKKLLESGEVVEDIDSTKLYKKEKHLKRIQRKARVRTRLETDVSAEKDFQPVHIGSEIIYVSKEFLPSDSILEESVIKQFRGMLVRIVEIMGGNPKTVKICFAPEFEDAFKESEQLLFNIAILQRVHPYYWIVVAARELAYHISSVPNAKHMRAMTLLIVKALKRIDEIKKILEWIKT